MKLGLSTSVAATILSSRRDSTVRIYNHTWKFFDKWCAARGMDPLLADHRAILEFLQDGLDKGLKPATLRRQVAALDSVLSILSSVTFSRHPLIGKFLKGAAAKSPPQRHRFPTWDLNVVLRALTKPPFEPIQEVGLKWLRWKTIFLVAITSARRISELGALSCHPDLCIFHKDKVVLRTDPSFVPKVSSRFHLSQELALPSFCPRPQHRLEREWHTLDVRRALKTFLNRTKDLRRSEHLFINVSPPNLGGRMSTQAIGTAIRSCISEAYKATRRVPPEGITAHSTRSAATSTALVNRASIEDICKAALWSSVSTFIRHYRLNTYSSADAAFGRRVLQQVIASHDVIPPGS